ncbi:MAG: hypothetical protein C4527_13260 [Candidatus Omnitrophota bacterium]|jgi:hypothetical protein|nr:MAG: hypothetical protein C4527_13260 [Candidatus Omnitrophota bacterium]
MNFILDIKKMKIDAEGIVDFHWPIERKEITLVRDTLLNAYIKIYQDHAHTHPEDSRIFGLFILTCLNRVMVLFQSWALWSRLTAKDIVPVISENSQWMQHYAHDAMPDVNDLSNQLINGPYRNQKWYAPLLRLLWRSKIFLAFNNFSMPRWLNPECIISTECTSFVVKHARSVSERIVYSSYTDWFPPVDREIAEASIHWKPLHETMIDEIVQETESAFQKFNITFTDKIKHYVREWIKQSTASIRWRCHLLSEQPDKLPKRLWTGTGGTIWAKIFRHVVHADGGHVTGHDHGIGAGHLKYPYKMLIDFMDCHQFVTFTPAHSDMLQQNLRQDWLISNHPPEICSLPISPGQEVKVAELSRRLHAPPRSVMYISSFYTGEWFHLAVQVPDYIQIDWESRLFGRLHQWGYTIYHKPHPESFEFPPEELYAPFHVIRLQDPFEKVMDRADVILFINPQSTAMVHALQTDIPLVFIDVGMFEWMPEAYRCLEKRCQIVPGRFDEQNRILIDWEELKDKIPKAVGMKDDSFRHNFIYPRNC